MSRVSDFQRKNNSEKSGGSDLNKEKEQENSSFGKWWLIQKNLENFENVC